MTKNERHEQERIEGYVARGKFMVEKIYQDIISAQARKKKR